MFEQQTQPQPPPPNRLALVSSLYGPGTIACWYLTALSVLLSWTLHPRKRRSGSIDVDLIAVLTLPAVAAGHLLSQIRRVAEQSSDDAQSIAAIEAPFNVTETFMPISVVLFLIAAWRFCVRRATAVALVGLLCFTVKYYTYFHNFVGLNSRYETEEGQPGRNESSAFSRSFVAESEGPIIALTATLSLFAFISAVIAFFIVALSNVIFQTSSRKALRRAFSRKELSSAHTWRNMNVTEESLRRARREDSDIRFITIATTCAFPITFVMCMIPPSFFILNSTTITSSGFVTRSPTAPSPWQTLRESMSTLAQGLVPRTAYAITDLDQAVAATAGATILGFNLCSMVKANYQGWSSSRLPFPESLAT